MPRILLGLLCLVALIHGRCTCGRPAAATPRDASPACPAPVNSPVTPASPALPGSANSNVSPAPSQVPAQASSQCSGGIPAAEVQGFLDVHNKMRQSISAGTYVAKGQSMPAAAIPIPNLTWDCGIEASAQAVASTCVFAHSQNRVNLGENLYYYSSSDQVPFTGQGKAASDDWESEFQNIGWPSVQFTEAEFESGIAHATQMAWANTTLIGCGMASCQGGTQVIVACQYRNAGNMIGENIYQPV